MKVHQERAWPTNAEEAIAIQQELRKKVVISDDLGTVKYVAGVDAAYIEGDSITRAAVAVLSFPKLQVKDSAIAIRPTSFPYVPGFLLRFALCCQISFARNYPHCRSTK